MPPQRQRRVPPVELQAGSDAARSLDWHSLRLFLELHRVGSFRATAARVGMSINSLRRHLDDLERVFGVPLFTRHFSGLRPTQEGDQLINGARAMEEVTFNLLRTRDALAGGVEGNVRVAVTEGLGSAWLTPRLHQFQALHPKLQIELNCGVNSADVLRMEADISVQLTRPIAPDLKLVRLGYLHSMPFASDGYVSRHGTPKDLNDLADHRLVLQISEQASQASLFAQSVPQMSRAPFVAFTSNMSSAHGLAVANGIGIGWLPTYVYVLHPGLVPIDCGVEFDFDIWLTYHPDVEAIPRVRQTIDWLRSSFDGRTFPFFAKNRIHPRDLPPSDQFASLTKWYGRFMP